MPELPQLHIDLNDTSRDDFPLEREWLVTNGLGGYASSTIHNLMSRRYHGLLVANMLHGRTVLIPRLDEIVCKGQQTARLNTVEFKDKSSLGDARQILRSFHIDGRTPVWRYGIGSTVIEKRIVMPHGHNGVCVSYAVLQGDPVALQVRAFVDFRQPHDSLSHTLDWTFATTVADRYTDVRTSEKMPPLRMAMTAAGGWARFKEDPQNSPGIYYRIEDERGHDSCADMFSPGVFELRIGSDETVYFLAGTDPSLSIFDQPPADLFAEEARRQETLICNMEDHAPLDDFSRQLVLAADQFIAQPKMDPVKAAETKINTQLVSIMAGYHWFTDWGRDTMIALEGLVLCTRRWDEAGAILRTFARYTHEGLIPNLFPEGHRDALYHTVDATLWFFHAIDRYVSITGDHSLLEELYPLLEDILAKHFRGTLFNIRMDDDGLLTQGAEGYQLTWMDAKVENWVVTPRRGKPVEIQGLWYNALSLMAEWAGLLERDADVYRQAAARCKESFDARFWCADAQHLFDVVDTPQGRDDPSLRPNQIFALSLKYPVLEKEKWKAVVDCVREYLWTPYGLRSLDQGHADYKAHYRGDLWARDAAYHQGMVWSWLIGPFLNAWCRVYEDPAEALDMLGSFETHLTEAGIGSISEIFDGDYPHYPRACIAQAWSVAEVLRCHLKLKAALEGCEVDGVGHKS